MYRWKLLIVWLTTFCLSFAMTTGPIDLSIIGPLT